MFNHIRNPGSILSTFLGRPSGGHKDTVSSDNVLSPDSVPVAPSVDSPDTDGSVRGFGSGYIRIDSKVDKMKRGDIVVEKYEGKADKFAGNGLHIHVSSNGVLCVRRYDKNIKVYAPGEWKTADVVE